MAELGCDEVLHEAGSNSVHICGALVQTHDARPPQKHARQAQQLLLPYTGAAPHAQPYTPFYTTVQGTAQPGQIVGHASATRSFSHIFFFFWNCSIISVEPLFQGQCFSLLKVVL